MLGNDQSPGGGHSATADRADAVAVPSSARQGRSSSITTFSTSLAPYASTVPRPVSTAPATRSVARRPRAVHQQSASSRPRTSRPASVAGSSSEASQCGASATAAATRR
ncbi:hypothetical protein ACIBJD_34840 [Kitasatospora sp. NPDC050467]|uniref:hypothetical protein n=1 Tax=Kitasatospora sp. NPDC050467 TaxID=3364053 RepID=UPI0037AC2C02